MKYIVESTEEGFMCDSVLTVDEIKALFAETARQMAETDRKMAETDRLIDKVTLDIAENGRQIDALRKELGGVGDSNGLVAEDIVYNLLEKRMSFAGIDFDEIDRGLSRGKKLPNGERIRGEYDVILYNGTTIAIIEIKYRVRPKNIERLIDVQLPRFRQIFPYYKDFKVYLGLGGMSFEKGVEEEALLRGIGTLKLDGESVVEINDKNVKAW